MTSSTEDSSGGPRSLLQLTGQEYAIIFQVTKELANLPLECYEGAGSIAAEDVDAIIGLARMIRHSGRDALSIVLAIVDQHPIAGGVVEEQSEHVLRVAVARQLVVRWQWLLTCVISWLDERELFLRTGHAGQQISRVLVRFQETDEIIGGSA